MRFSIIIPIYNAEKYLRQCIDSVLQQIFQDFEVILVDDGSPDNCPLICDEYANHDNRIKVIHKQNGGASDARNAGIEIASGDYIIFVDSDDWWRDKYALKAIAETIDKVNCDILIFGMGKYDERTRQFYDIKIPQMPSNDNNYYAKSEAVASGIYKATPCDKVINRNLIDKLNLRFLKEQLSEDIEWCIRILHHANYIAVLPEHIYVYRQNLASMSHNVHRKHVEDILQVIKKYTTDEFKTDEAVINFVALQFVFLMATAARVDSKEIRDLMDDMKSYTYLLDYAANPQVKIVRKFRYLGIRGILLLLRIYQKIKH